MASVRAREGEREGGSSKDRRGRGGKEREEGERGMFPVDILIKTVTLKKTLP